MWVLILLDGMLTSSWYAVLAFRMRVSMSAIGSVMVMGGRGPFSPWYPGVPVRTCGAWKSCTGVTSCSW